MEQRQALTRQRLTTPRAAAVAGILFAVLLSASVVLMRVSIPADPRENGDWLATSLQFVRLGLNIVPFAGIAFLWFIGVVRDRLGDYEDRFFATVFLGSGLLFLAMFFVSAGLAGGILISYELTGRVQIDSGAYAFGRAVMYVIVNTYAFRMAGVFMISTCTVFLRTRVTPRWMAYLGYALALLLLLIVTDFSWTILVFPMWILLISVYILVENFRPRRSLAP